jgi:hypothetical protein
VRNGKLVLINEVSVSVSVWQKCAQLYLSVGVLQQLHQKVKRSALPEQRAWGFVLKVTRGLEAHPQSDPKGGLPVAWLMEMEAAPSEGLKLALAAQVLRGNHSPGPPVVTELLLLYR